MTLKFTKARKPSWRIIFNTEPKWYGHIDYAMKKAYECGYPLFSWNGRIYEIEENKTMGILLGCTDTGWLESEID